MESKEGGDQGERTTPSTSHLTDGLHRSQDDVSLLLDAVQNMLLVETPKFRGCCVVTMSNKIVGFVNPIPFTVGTQYGVCLMLKLAVGAMNLV